MPTHRCSFLTDKMLDARALRSLLLLLAVLLAAGCIEAPDTEICNDGIDNDIDGLVDCDDADCTDDPSCEGTPPGQENCNDGEDNDANGFIDCLDEECDTIGSCEFGTELSCADGTDNDGDGDTCDADDDNDTDEIEESTIGEEIAGDLL